MSPHFNLWLHQKWCGGENEKAFEYLGVLPAQFYLLQNESLLFPGLPPN